MLTKTITRDEHHDVPEGEQHHLDAYCSCRPEVVLVVRGPDGELEEVQIVHRTWAAVMEPVTA